MIVEMTRKASNLSDFTDSQLREYLPSNYDFNKDDGLSNGLRRMRWINYIRRHNSTLLKKKKKEVKENKRIETELVSDAVDVVIEEIDDNAEEKLPKNYYFDNEKVEKLLQQYVDGACTNVGLRDEIMEHASELIRQIIRAHGLHNIYPGREDSSFYDLFQLAWVQIESTLYKYQRGRAKVFNMMCLNPETKVFSDQGVISLSEALNCDKKLFGLNGLKRVNASIKKPTQKTKVVTTQMGYMLEATPEHRLYRLGQGGPEWVQVCDLNHDDLLGIQFGQHVFLNQDMTSDIKLTESGSWESPKKLTTEMAYLFGLYLSEGSYSRREFDIINADKEVIDFLANNKLGLHFRRHNLKNYAYCRRFSEFLDEIGFNDCHDSHTKKIPSRLLMMSRENIVALLQGLFDGDGHSSRFNGVVGYTSTSKELINQIRMLLLNFGILTKISKDERTTGAYQLILSTSDSEKFYSRIGFRIKRKQIKRSRLRGVRREPIYGLNKKFLKLYQKYGPRGKYDQIKKILKSNFISLNKAKKMLSYWSNFNADENYLFIKQRIDEFERLICGVVWLPIIKIKDSECAVCDVEIDSPDHSYIANGFISHNSQVARTVILAHIKKEGRDKKNCKPYQNVLVHKHGTTRSVMFERFLEEAREICKHNDDHLVILDALGRLFDVDQKPYDGLVGKLIKMSGKTRQQVVGFIETLRMRSFEFTDSPINHKPTPHPLTYQGVPDDED